MVETGYKLISGGMFEDKRGIIRFVNDFQFQGILRFYLIHPASLDEIRAWQGHKNETKWFYVAKGSFLINWIKIDNWEKPSKDLSVQSLILRDKKSEILMIDLGQVTGFKALEENSVLIVFSNKSLEESEKDDFRYNITTWNFTNPTNDSNIII